MGEQILHRSQRAAVPGLGIPDGDTAGKSGGYTKVQKSSNINKPLRSNERQDLIESFDVRPVGDILVASWTWRNNQTKKDIKVTNLYYYTNSRNPRVSKDVSNLLEYRFKRLKNETQYQVCIRVQKHSTNQDDLICRNSASKPWHMPASIGSSVGALLALLVVVLVMVSLQRKRRHRRLNGNGPASKRSRIDSALESQFDSIAFREETSFYDDTTLYDSTCAESCLHSSCGANSAVLVGLSAQASNESEEASEPPVLGRSVSSSAGAKSVTFKEERSGKYGLLERRESEESRDKEPASVVLETVIDPSPAVAGGEVKGDPGGGLYTQLIETI